MVPLKFALTVGGAWRPWRRSAGEAGVRVLNEQTKTERYPSSTVIPAWVTSPPKTNTDPGDGLMTSVGSLDGFSSTFRFPAQNPVPPPRKSSPTVVNGIKIVNAR